MSIKENIKKELLKMCNEEEKNIRYRRNMVSTNDELYQIRCSENFVEQIKEFAESI